MATLVTKVAQTMASLVRGRGNKVPLKNKEEKEIDRASTLLPGSHVRHLQVKLSCGRGAREECAVCKFLCWRTERNCAKNSRRQIEAAPRATLQAPRLVQCGGSALRAAAPSTSGRRGDTDGVVMRCNGATLCGEHPSYWAWGTRSGLFLETETSGIGIDERVSG